MAANSHLRADLVAKAHLRADLVAKAHLRADLVAKAHLRADLVAKAHLRADLVAKAHPRADLVAKSHLHADLAATYHIRADLVAKSPFRADMAANFDPSPLKSFSHWPLSSSHPLLTAGSTRRNRSSLSLTTLSDLNAAALALHPTPFALLTPATPSSPCRPFSFSTSFTFRISSPNAAGLGGEGLAFVMLPSPTLGLPGPSLGYGRLLLPPGSTTGADDSQVRASHQHQQCSISGTCHLTYVSSQQHRSLAVEFDTSSSPEFFDRPDHHVGMNLHGSMLSLASAPVHPLGIPSLNAGQTLLATIQYNASSSHLTVWLSPAPSSSPPPSTPRSSCRFPCFPGFPRFTRSPSPSSSSSSSSHSAPSLPRSAVLTTFVDTCEWLGGNDPEAAAPPPPLFVGFTAATGKGAEQAQAHEVLGWSFQVGEGEFQVGEGEFQVGEGEFQVGEGEFQVGEGEFQVGEGEFQVGEGEFQVGEGEFQVGEGEFQVGEGEFQVGEGEFQAGKAAEDPLPFWAADSFSFPYITPATPLLTRGSTRKRFFAADLSVDADVASIGQSNNPAPGAIFFPCHSDFCTHSPVLPCGMGTCSIPRLKSFPAHPSPPPWADTDYCNHSPVLPCGMGACSKARSPWDPSVLLPSCKCPLKLPSFEPTHLAGLPSCFPGEPWSAIGELPSFEPTHLAGLPSCFPGETWSAPNVAFMPTLLRSYIRFLRRLKNHIEAPQNVAVMPTLLRSYMHTPLLRWMGLTFALPPSTVSPQSPPLPSFSSPSPPFLLFPPPLPPSSISTLPSPHPTVPSSEAYTCRQLSSNPCAPGVCIDGIDGAYSCLCPSPYFPFTFSPKGTASCSLVQADGMRIPTFLSHFGLTCSCF
ncbi:unnamed protein product [Closterium sp. Naga37s-1]|nr:unnamed protein product [Closterium sp. Naga37s-1]